MKVKSPLKFGIIGFSDIARRKFIPALINSDSAVLAAIGSRDTHRHYVEICGVKAPLLSYNDLIDSPDIDALYISLPNTLHEDACLRGAKRGKHIICEKPLGLSPASVERMMAAANATKVLLFENLMYLQHPLMKAVKSAADSGIIGKITALDAVFTIPELSPDNIRMNPFLGGGAFNDLNRYPLTAAYQLLCGKEHTVLSAFSNDKDGVDIAFKASSITECDERFSFEIGFSKSYRSCYELFGEHGSIFVDRGFTTPSDMDVEVVIKRDGITENKRVPAADHFRLTIDFFSSVVASGEWCEIHSRSHYLAKLAEIFRESQPK